MRWMLDTDTCIALIRGKHEQALRRLRARTIGQVGISSITLSELAYGVARSAKRAENAGALEQFLLPLEIAPFGVDEAHATGDIRAHLASKGTPIGPMDTLIAAHARSIDAILVTHNVREFGRVINLRVEDWLVS